MRYICMKFKRSFEAVRKRGRMRTSGIVMVSLFVLAGCGNGGPGQLDVGTDVTGADPGTEVIDAALDGIPSTGSRARVIVDEGDLIGGRQASGVTGDILLVNDHVRFVVRTRERGLYGPYGGNLVDADLVRPEGEPGRDRFLEMFPMIGFGRTLRPDSIDIVDDGIETGRAVVRVRGTDAGVPLIDSLIPTLPLGTEATLDYVLAADARHLEIIARVQNPGTIPLDVSIGQVIQFGNSLERFDHRCGTDSECLIGRDDVDWLAASGGDVSYGFSVTPESHPEVVFTREEILLVQTGSSTIQSQGQVEVRQYLMVGEGTVSGVARAAWEVRGEPDLVSLPVTISRKGKQDLQEVRLEARLAGSNGTARYVSRTRPDSGGHAVLVLPPGSYDLVVTDPGLPPVVRENVEVSGGGAAPVVFHMEDPGRLHITTEDENGAALHAMAVLQAGHNAPWNAGGVRTILVPNGETVVPVLPGEYTITVSRGFEYGIHREDITVALGAATDVVSTLSREVDTSGWVAMDTHDHCEWSIDSDVLVEDRIANALGTGVEVLAITDHDHFGSLQPVIEALGFAGDIRGVSGNEISPLWGHTTAIDCDPGYDYDTYFAVPFLIYDDDSLVEQVLTPSETWTVAREEFHCSLLAIAHPWCSQATFQHFGLEPGDDPVDLLPGLDLGLVDAVEIVNSHDEWDEIFTENLPGWFDLLARGYDLAGLGGSDGHTISTTFGHPRNLVRSSTDNPRDVDVDELITNIKGFGSQVVGGPFIELTVNGEGIGSVVVDTDGTVDVGIRVQAPAWMVVDYVRLWVNGQEVAVPQPMGEGVVRLDETVEVDIVQDAFIVAAAGSDSWRMGPACNGRPPITITNPVFVDLEGDGYQPSLGPHLPLSLRFPGPPAGLRDFRAEPAELADRLSTFPPAVGLLRRTSASPRSPLQCPQDTDGRYRNDSNDGDPRHALSRVLVPGGNAHGRGHRV